MGRLLFITSAFLAMVSINIAANLLPLNGQSTADISNRFPVLFRPASYVFYIWIIIYFLIGYWVVQQWKKLRQEQLVTLLQASAFVASCCFNILWIFLWHYEFFISSIIAMVLLVASLAVLYLTFPKENEWKERIPFSIYLGWASVATIANISYVLTVHQWSGWGLTNPLWAVIMMTFGAAFALHMRFHYFDPVLPIVFIWAYIGIAVKNGFDELLVSTAAIFLSGVVLFGIFFIKKKTEGTKQPVEDFH